MISRQMADGRPKGMNRFFVFKEVCKILPKKIVEKYNIKREVFRITNYGRTDPDIVAQEILNSLDLLRKKSPQKK